jgi:hypothetical protein
MLVGSSGATRAVRSLLAAERRLAGWNDQEEEEADREYRKALD